MRIKIRMMKNKDIKDYPDIKLIAYLSLAISVLMHLAMFLSFSFGDGLVYQQIGEHKKPPFHIDGFLLNVLSTFILAFVLYLYNMYIQKNVRMGKNNKLFVMILGSIIITIVMSFIFTTLHPYILNYAEHNHRSKSVV